MNIDEKKRTALQFLNELETEVTILYNRICNARKEIPKIETEKDVDAFIQNNDLEKDLDYISLHLKG